MALDNSSSASTMSSYIFLPSTKTHFQLLVTIEGKDYVLHVVAPNFPSMEKCSLSGCLDLKTALVNAGFKDENLDNVNGVEELVERVAGFIRQSSKLFTRKEFARDLPEYERVVHDLDAIGLDKLVSISQDLSDVKLLAKDSRGCEHVLSVNLETNKIYADFPEGWHFSWKQILSLKQIYEEFCREMESYDEFWQTMDELDSNCWVLEPENPSRKDAYRKISIGSNVSIKIVVNPRHPRSFPLITWLGSETAVQTLRQKFADRMEAWQPELAIHENLQLLMEAKLPQKESEQLEECEVVCSICYSSRLNGRVPSRTCDNPKCSQSFHLFCLYEWLRSLIQSRKLGNRIFGLCPYCEMAISCKPDDV